MQPGHAERLTGSAQTLFVDELDRVCRLLRQEWASLYSVTWSKELQLDWHTDVLCLAVHHGLSLYVSQAIEKEGQKLLQWTGRPLLFHAVENYPQITLKIVRILLENGVDPNQTFGLSTAWSHALNHPRIYAFIDKWHSKWYSGFIILMLSYGANPCQRLSRDPGFWWRNYKKPAYYTTAFHIALTYMEYFTEIEKKTVIRSFLDHCDNYNMVDSDGVGIAEWADTAHWYNYDSSRKEPIDSWIGDFIRSEIAARTTGEEYRVRLDSVSQTKRKRPRRD